MSFLYILGYACFDAGMGGYSGGLPLRIAPIGQVKIFVFIIIGYLMVMGLDFWRMKKIPTDGGLKMWNKKTR